jgi:hypothetical protein
MHCIFIGGNLDGTLGSDSAAGSCSGAITLQGENSSDTYHIANGIARHESVSEEEVARRVYGWHEVARQLVEASTEKLMSHGRIKLSDLGISLEE